VELRGWGTFDYRVDCAGMEIAHGSIERVNDHTWRPTARVVLDGGDHSVSFDRLPPILELVDPDSNDESTVFIENNHAVVSETLSRRGDTYVLDAVGLAMFEFEKNQRREEWSFTMWFKSGRRTSVSLKHQPTLQLTSPVDGATWSEQVTVSGRALGAVTINGRSIPTTGVDGFETIVERDAGQPITIRVEPLTGGTQFYVKRPARAVTVASSPHDVANALASSGELAQACGHLGGKVTIDAVIEAGAMKSVSIADATTPELARCVNAALAKITLPAKLHGHFRFTLAVPTDFDFSCDALKEQGLTAESNSQHAEALQAFEAALRCDPKLARGEQLAFMAACNTGDVASARRHYLQLDDNTRRRFLQLCIRNNITEADLLAVPGTLQITTSGPGATVYIDGRKIEGVTPIQLGLQPGVHKVLVKNGATSMTSTVSIEAGKTSQLDVQAP
jgi:hypothetical protein